MRQETTISSEHLTLGFRGLCQLMLSKLYVVGRGRRLQKWETIGRPFTYVLCGQSIAGKEIVDCSEGKEEIITVPKSGCIQYLKTLKCNFDFVSNFDIMQDFLESLMLVLSLFTFFVVLMTLVFGSACTHLNYFTSTISPKIPATSCQHRYWVLSFVSLTKVSLIYQKKITKEPRRGETKVVAFWKLLVSTPK